MANPVMTPGATERGVGLVEEVFLRNFRKEINDGVGSVEIHVSSISYYGDIDGLTSKHEPRRQLLVTFVPTRQGVVSVGLTRYPKDQLRPYLVRCQLI